MSASADVIVVGMGLAGPVAAELADVGRRARVPEHQAGPRQNPCGRTLRPPGSCFVAHSHMRADGCLTTIRGELRGGRAKTWARL